MDDWIITAAACDRYAHAMRWGAADHARARAELQSLLATASLRDTDYAGMQLWRCSKRLGRGLRVVVDPPGTVVWVGHGVPPRHLWMAPR